MKINIFKIQKEINSIRNILEDQRIEGFMRSGYLDQISTLEHQKAFVIQTVGILVPMVAVLSTLIFSYIQNHRENADFQLRIRPYLVVDTTESSSVISGKSADFRIHVKNVGALPAQVVNAFILCPPSNQKMPVETRTIIGNGEEMIFNFSVVPESSSVRCTFSVSYAIPTESFADLFMRGSFYTEYILRFRNNGAPVYEKATLH